MGKPALSYQDLWDACDSERQRARAWMDFHASEGNADIAARFAAEYRVFEALQTLVGRIADSARIKDELKAIARRERASAQSSDDNEVIYDHD